MLYKIFQINNLKVVLLWAWSLIIGFNILQTAIYKMSNPSYDWMWVVKFPIITLFVGLFLIFFLDLTRLPFFKKKSVTAKSSFIHSTCSYFSINICIINISNIWVLVWPFELEMVYRYRIQFLYHRFS